jgi:hypothetical protein
LLKKAALRRGERETARRSSLDPYPEPAMLVPAKPRRLDAPIVISLEELVPANHCYRHSEANLDLGVVREWGNDGYTERGRPCICPPRPRRPGRKTKYTEEEVVDRADGAICHTCAVKAACTTSNRGRIVTGPSMPATWSR